MFAKTSSILSFEKLYIEPQTKVSWSKYFFGESSTYSFLNPSPLSRNEPGGSKLEYPIDVSGNPAYAATIKFQVLEYTAASPGKSQKNHIVSATDNIQSQETTKARVEDETCRTESPYSVLRTSSCSPESSRQTP